MYIWRNTSTLKFRPKALIRFESFNAEFIKGSLLIWKIKKKTSQQIKVCANQISPRGYSLIYRFIQMSCRIWNSYTFAVSLPLSLKYFKYLNCFIFKVEIILKYCFCTVIAPTLIVISPVKFSLSVAGKARQRHYAKISIQNVRDILYYNTYKMK